MFRTLGLIAVLVGLTSAAKAMPLATFDGADRPQITLVYGGCGVFGHRGPWGGCRPGGQLGGYIPGASCPAGFHIGPLGRHCWPNWY